MSSVVVESSDVAQFVQEKSAPKATVLHLETLVEKLRFQLAQLTRRQFGVSAEGLTQLGLWSPDVRFCSNSAARLVGNCACVGGRTWLRMGPRDDRFG